jgi:hypothetical protein
MRTTVNIDDRLLAEASKVTGEKERTRLLHDGLRALIARENARAIIALGGSELGKLLMLDHALMHPHVLGEIALGNLGQRKSIIDRFLMLPVPNIASEGHVLSMIETGGFIATGIGYTDAHLLASTLITPGGRLWTRDKRLHAQAARLGIAYTD